MLSLLELLTAFSTFDGSSEIPEAIFHRSVARLQMAIKLTPSYVRFRFAAGLSVLHLASDWPSELSFLLSAGADIDACCNGGSTPVMFAIIQGCNETVELLLKPPASSMTRARLVVVFWKRLSANS